MEEKHTKRPKVKGVRAEMSLAPPKGKKKLKNFGKKRHEIRMVNSTTYDAEGHWVSAQHQEEMRRIQNPLFDRYYRELQMLGAFGAATPASLDHPSVTPPVDSDEGNDDHHQSTTADQQWEEEMRLFRTPLPTTFWVNDTDPLAGEVRRYLETLDSALIRPITWYPIPGMAWRVLANKVDLRKRPEMQALRHYLIRQTVLGTISRQEEVSMIPPFLLDIQPEDVCLDMCASPGSKTAQMLVALGRHKMVPTATFMEQLFPFNYASEGLIVANELDIKRANMLVHQVKRLHLLFPFALFTNHDARYFPDVVLQPESVGVSQDVPASEGVTRAAPIMRFDKILCDVVCSGDGTLRKAPHIFKIWSPKEGMTLQKTQIHIALRACHLLKIGGRMVYSTCSLNPVENEAVVAQIVHRTHGAMKLVDARQLLPQLHCAPGLQTWTVTNAKGNVVAHPGEMHEALFPPHTPGGYSSPAIDALDLRLCMRLLPSHCDGGGFFIAVLDKVKEFFLPKKGSEGRASGGEAVELREAGGDGAASLESRLNEEEETGNKKELQEHQDLKETAGGECCSWSDFATRPQRKPKGIPPHFARPPLAIHDALVHFYEIHNFPEELLVMRTAEGTREVRATLSSHCSIVSKTARRVLAHKTDTLVVVSAGLRVFAFETLNKGWRIACEAASLFPKLMQHSPRRLQVPCSFVEEMINGGKLKEVLLRDIKDSQLREQLEKLSLGTVLLEINCPAAPQGIFYSVALRARTKMQLLVDREDLVRMQLCLGL